MKNIFLKKRSLLIFLIIFSLLAIPLWNVKAISIASLASNIAFAFIAFFLQFALLAALGFFYIGEIVLFIAISPEFISLPYTSGGIVAIGWPIVRDFANLGFVLALILIGIGTALKLNEYNFKKALPRLIAMILLVNFTPVICGIIVDATNIVMNFFLNAMPDIPGAFRAAAASKAAYILNDLSKFFTEPVVLEIVAGTLVMIFFYVFAAFFFLLYAALFLTRYVAIWYLVIISPLAFLSFALSSKGVAWKKWWNQFIQWSFVGIPAAFYLYLTGQLIALSSSMVPPPQATANATIGDILNSVVVYIPAFIFLFIGFLSSLSSGAMGADTIIATAKKWGKSAQQWAGKQLKTGEQRLGRAAMGTKEVGQFFDDLAKRGNDIKGIGGWAIRTMALKGKETRLKQMNDIENIKDPKIDAIIKSKDSNAAIAYLKSHLIDPLNRIRLTEKMAEEWDEEDMMKVRNSPGVDPLVRRNIALAAKRGLLPTIKKMTKDKPSLAKIKEVCDANIDNPDSEEMQTKLQRQHEQMLIIANKIRLGENLNDWEKSIVNEAADNLSPGLANENAKQIWFSGLGLNRTTSEITLDKGGAYYALAGQYLLEKTVATMKTDAIPKMSKESIESQTVMKAAAYSWTPEKLSAFYNGFGSEKYGKFISEYSNDNEGAVINTWDMVTKNEKLPRSRYYGNNRNLFEDFPAYNPDKTVAKINGQTVWINSPEKYDEYSAYVKSGGRIDKRPLWMGGTTTPSPTGGTPPTGGTRTPRTPRSRGGGPRTSPLPAGAIPFGSNIPGSQSENVAARETDRIQKDIERRDREARKADREREEQGAITAAAEAMAANSPYKIGERVTVQGGKTGIVDKIPASGFVEVKYDDGTRSAWPIRQVQPPTTPNPNSPPPAPVAGGGRATVSSIPQGASPAWFINNMPPVPLQDLEKGPQIGYAGGKILKHESGAGENLEAHPVPGGIAYRTMIPPGMAGTPKKIEISVGSGWRTITNGQPFLSDRKSTIRIDGVEHRVSKDYTLIKSQPKT